MEICNRLRLEAGRDLYGITGYRRKMNRSRKKQRMQILCCYRSRVRVFRFPKENREKSIGGGEKNNHFERDLSRFKQAR